MAGKTVSAHVGEGVVRRVEEIARLEARPVSQVVAAALAFYTRLPADAHQSLRTLEALGGAAAVDEAAYRAARAVVAVTFDVAERRLVEAIPEEVIAGLGALETEDDILAAAVRLTAREPSEAAAPEPAPPRRRGSRARAA